MQISPAIYYVLISLFFKTASVCNQNIVWRYSIQAETDNYFTKRDLWYYQSLIWTSFIFNLIWKCQGSGTQLQYTCDAELTITVCASFSKAVVIRAHKWSKAKMILKPTVHHSYNQYLIKMNRDADDLQLIISRFRSVWTV